MRKMCIFGAIFAGFCAALLLVGCGAGGYGPVLKANWDLELPSGCREAYETDTGASFQGDGVRYHVFTCVSGEAVAETLEKWADADGQKAGGSYVAQLVEEYLQELGVPAEQLPDYENCRFWMMIGQDDSRDQILVFLDESANRVYVLESFM